MNFADAIRQANRQIAPPPPELFPVREATYAAAQPATPPAVKEPKPAAVVPEEVKIESESTPEFVYEPPVAAGNTTVIRLEMFLTAEQISALFRSVATSQHSVLTLREAANHLRISAHSLEELAVSAEIPAFFVDGKWKFPKAGLDEWVALQVARKEAS